MTIDGVALVFYIGSFSPCDCAAQNINVGVNVKITQPKSHSYKVIGKQHFLNFSRVEMIKDSSLCGFHVLSTLNIQNPNQ